jgi:hypothetical protein
MPAAATHGSAGRRRNRLARALALVLAALALSVPAAVAWAQQGRVALVLGNGAYRSVPRLANPGQDAQGMAQTLRGIGFQVELVRDATRAQIEEALRRFGRAADGAEIALFFYAGHGMQVGGENYLMPVDARVADARDIDYELIALPLVTRAMERARVRILILDACRDNPLAAQIRGLSGTRSVGRGLARIEQVDLGTLVAFATSPGAVALDGAGRNSPFTAALLQHLPTPGLEIRQVMTRVRASVVQETGGQQIPWDNSSLITEVVLRPGAGGTVAAAPPPAPRPVPEPAQPQRLAAPGGQPAPPPAATPAAPAALPSAAAGFTVARAIAAERQIPLPAALPAPTQPRSTSGLGRFLGAWGGRTMWNQLGREVLLIVLAVDENAGTAEVLLAGNLGNPGTFSDGLSPGFERARARYQFGKLVWTDSAGERYEVSPLLAGDGLELVQTRSLASPRQSGAQARTHLPRIE